MKAGDPEGRYTACHCQETKRRKDSIAYLRKVANFPDDIEAQTFGGMDLSHTDTANMVKAAQGYVANQQPPILAFIGGNGNGKTRIALATAKALLEMREMPVYFAYLPMFLKELQKGQFTGADYKGQDHYELLERACGKGLVVLDDMGLYKPTDWADVQFETIMGYRYMQGLPTIITTNLKFAQLPVRMKSRLSDAAKCRPVVIEAPDHRNVNRPMSRNGQ